MDFLKLVSSSSVFFPFFLPRKGPAAGTRALISVEAARQCRGVVSFETGTTGKNFLFGNILRVCCGYGFFFCQDTRRRPNSTTPVAHSLSAVSVRSWNCWHSGGRGVHDEGVQHNLLFTRKPLSLQVTRWLLFSSIGFLLVFQSIPIEQRENWLCKWVQKGNDVLNKLQPKQTQESVKAAELNMDVCSSISYHGSFRVSHLRLKHTSRLHFLQNVINAIHRSRRKIGFYTDHEKHAKFRK